ncbi:hypothetical protein ESP62_006130 [Aeromicrobium fastidiosum]|uniref:Uncharacterized protein n=1 Tax=Aeromicrobium fastidiosum TaxID=52699 RepID=A0A641ARJ6_9ACTN|nr:hypothetical protein ESP62_006130 [Aeromicrobium fastidiosum]
MQPSVSARTPRSRGIPATVHRARTTARRPRPTARRTTSPPRRRGALVIWLTRMGGPSVVDGRAPRAATTRKR